MSNTMATIEKVVKTYPIESADNIEMTQVLDYHVVTKKGEFKAGDFVIYARVDSIFPDGLSEEDKIKHSELKKIKKEHSDNVDIDNQISEVLSRNTIPEFEFLRKDKFTIKAKKYSKFRNELGNKIISEGIIFPTTILKNKQYIIEGKDVTSLLGITKVVEDEEEIITEEKENKIKKFLFKYKLFRKLYFIFAPKKISGNWESWLPAKSDEENIQKLFSKIVFNHGRNNYVVTEKLEGRNISFYKYETKSWFGKKVNYGVCSRNRHLPKDDGSDFWSAVKDNDFLNKLKNCEGNILVRGENCGPKIQGNIYKLTKDKIFIFDVYNIKNQRFYNYQETVEFCNRYGFEMVPVISDNFTLPETVLELLEFSNGKSVLYPTMREGLVIRKKDDYTISFKAKSPEYLAKK